MKRNHKENAAFLSLLVRSLSIVGFGCCPEGPGECGPLCNFYLNDPLYAPQKGEEGKIDPNSALSLIRSSIFPPSTSPDLFDKSLLPRETERSSGVIRGYLPPLYESGYGALFTESKQCFSYGFNRFDKSGEGPPALSQMEGSNLYPQAFVEGGEERLALDTVYDEFHRLAALLLEAIAPGVVGGEEGVETVDWDGGKRNSV